jgi:hypothetical protein
MCEKTADICLCRHTFWHIDLSEQSGDPTNRIIEIRCERLKIIL